MNTSWLPFNYQPPQDLLKNRIILITGAGDGIGKAVATACGKHQASVILLGKTVRKLEQVYDAIVDQGGPQPAIFPCNLETASPDDYLQLVDSVEREFGRLDSLVLNAAWLGSLTPIVHYDVHLWSRVIQTNLNANFLLARESYPLLKKSAAANLLFTSDVVAQTATAYYGAYAVAKSGCDTLMRILAQEWETNTCIRVNSLDPGNVHTNLRRQAFPGEDARTLPSADSVVPAYLYLLGAAHGLRGQVLAVPTHTCGKTSP
ncbi:MAG: SDR family NAD(P)-dependent oxidoreductase [Gammaproteobacteria bacterium]|nr:SDR family NAD(P)-dependent oxidoreductase [Gammaproteobacteria bacterium]